MKNLTGRTAFITGASRGIGAAGAKALAEAGAHVFLTARNEADLEQLALEIKSAGGNARWLKCDVSDPADVARAITACGEAFGGLDILLNNAGVINPIARLEESDADEWARVVDINLKGVYFALRYAIPYLKASKRSTVINISSGAATGALEGWSHYCATKAAVLSLTKCAHKELAEHGIDVVGLSPGTVATDMQVSIRSSGINPVSQLDPSVHIPAEWVARTIVWLVETGAAEYAGGDFSLKTDEGRARVGLPAL